MLTATLTVLNIRCPSVVYVDSHFHSTCPPVVCVFYEFLLQLHFLLFLKRFYEDIICVKSGKNFNFAFTCHPLSVYFCSIIFSNNELKFVTHIFQIFDGVDAHLKYGLCKLALFWFWNITPKSSPQKQLIQVIPNGFVLF